MLHLGARHAALDERRRPHAAALSGSKRGAPSARASAGGARLMASARVATAAAHRRAAPGRLRLLRDDQAEGPVAAALHHGRHDVVAGDPSLELVFLTCLGGYLSAGGAGAVNHWYDRDLDRAMSRTADRPVASGRVAPERGARLRPGAGGAVGRWCSRVGVNPLAAALSLLGLPRLHARLHRLAQALHAAEHRDRRRRGRRAAAGRLGRGDRQPQLDRRVPVRDRLLLDPAPLLGAFAADEGRLRQGGRADDAGGPRRARDAPADPPLLRPAVRGHRSCPFCAGGFDGIYAVSSIVLGAVFIGGAVRLYRRADRRSALWLYLYSLAYLALLFAAMVADARF